MTTDRLAAMLHEAFKPMRFGPCWHPEQGEYPNECDEIAASLAAAGVTVAQPAEVPLHLANVTPTRDFNLTRPEDFKWLADYFSGYHGVPGLRARLADYEAQPAELDVERLAAALHETGTGRDCNGWVRLPDPDPELDLIYARRIARAYTTTPQPAVDREAEKQRRYDERIGRIRDAVEAAQPAPDALRAALYRANLALDDLRLAAHGNDCHLDSPCEARLAIQEANHVLNALRVAAQAVCDAPWHKGLGWANVVEADACIDAVNALRAALGDEP